MYLLRLFENTFDRKRISANPNSNPNTQQRFRIDKMTSFFEKVAQIPINKKFFKIDFHTFLKCPIVIFLIGYLGILAPIVPYINNFY